MEKKYIVRIDSSVSDIEESLVGPESQDLLLLAQYRLPVLNGFVVTPLAFREFVQTNKLDSQLQSFFASHFSLDVDGLYLDDSFLQEIFDKATIPDQVKSAIVDAYSEFGPFWKQERVNLSISSIPETPLTSKYFKNLKGDAVVLNTIKEIWLNLFTSASLAYARKDGVSIEDFSASILVQSVLNFERSGIAYIPWDKNTLLIKAVWGNSLGVWHKVAPFADKYWVGRVWFDIVKKERYPQDIYFQISDDGQKQHKADYPTWPKLDEKEIKELAKILASVHKLKYFPQKVWWGYKDDQFYIVKLTQIQKNPMPLLKKKIKNQMLLPKARLVVKASGLGGGIGTGFLKIIRSHRDIRKIRQGDVILVDEGTELDRHVFRKISGVIIQGKSKLPHLGMETAELGIPTIVGVDDLGLQEGEAVTVHGVDGLVFLGSPLVSPIEKTVKRKSLIEPHIRKTKLYSIVADITDLALVDRLTLDGIGVFPADILLLKTGCHPKHLKAQGRLEKDIFEHLHRLLTKTVASMYPRPVFFQPIDLSSKDYRRLDSGKYFEEEEANPLLGYRGGIRFLTDSEIFDAEMQQVAKVRQKFKNLHLILPFIRTPSELIQLKRRISAYGLVRGVDFQIWLKASVPANILALEDFVSTGIDGIGIDLDLLEALFLGVDKTSGGILTQIQFDELIYRLVRESLEKIEQLNIGCFVYGKLVNQESFIENLLSAGVPALGVLPKDFQKIHDIVCIFEQELVKQK